MKALEEASQQFSQWVALKRFESCVLLHCAVRCCLLAHLNLADWRQVAGPRQLADLQWCIKHQLRTQLISLITSSVSCRSCPSLNRICSRQRVLLPTTSHTTIDQVSSTDQAIATSAVALQCNQRRPLNLPIPYGAEFIIEIKQCRKKCMICARVSVPLVCPSSN